MMFGPRFVAKPSSVFGFYLMRLTVKEMKFNLFDNGNIYVSIFAPYFLIFLVIRLCYIIYCCVFILCIVDSFQIKQVYLIF